MRILVLGAGGTGGYFGGRLAQSAAQVTFLVRPARAADLQRNGLRIRSPLGDVDMAVNTLTAEALPAQLARQRFDLVLLSCKAYDLDSAIQAIAPAVHAGAEVLPVLNGLLHYPVLDHAFGKASVLGGLCFISVTQGDQGEILHLARPASLTFGERGGAAVRPGLAQFAQVCAAAGIEHLLSPDIEQEQWIKYSFLTALAAGTCLMRASVGQIVAGEGGAAFMAELYAECTAVAAAHAKPIPSASQTAALAALCRPDSPMKASMLRDLEAGRRVEGLHIVGDMQHRAAKAGITAPLLSTAWCHLQAYALSQAGG